MNSLPVEILIAAPPTAVYACWKMPNMLSRWLADSATVDLRTGGVFTLTWLDARWAAGNFTHVEPETRLVFSWQRSDAPASTRIEVTFAAEGEGTRVVLTRQADDEFGWREALQNLRVLLEAGSDGRLLSRPAMGVGLIPISAEEAAAKALPLAYGLNLTLVTEGGAAFEAGLRADDYLTGMDGLKLGEFGDFNAVIARHSAGDTVDVEFCRDRQIATTRMTFGKRQIPTPPQTREALYAAVEARIATIEHELDTIFAGVPEAALNVKPAPNEWSAKEVLAHLLWTERWIQMAQWLTITVGTETHWGYNNDFEIAGIAATRATAYELLGDLKENLREQLHAVHHIPDAVLAIRPLYTRLAIWMTQTGDHIDEHYDQLRACVAYGVRAASA